MSDEATDAERVLNPEEVARAARKAEVEAVVAPLREKYGELGVFPISKFGLIVVQKPTFEAFSRFQNRVTTDGVDQASEILELVMSCVVHPDAPAARAIFKKQPYALQKVSQRVRELGGSEIEDLGKD